MQIYFQKFDCLKTDNMLSGDTTYDATGEKTINHLFERSCGITSTCIQCIEYMYLPCSNVNTTNVQRYYREKPGFGITIRVKKSALCNPFTTGTVFLLLSTPTSYSYSRYKLSVGP